MVRRTIWFTRKGAKCKGVLIRAAITPLLNVFPSRPGLLVLNYHRIGTAADSQFDRGVFAASLDTFEQQLALIKGRFPVIGLTETIHLLSEPKRMKRFYVLLTFDDGYVDNYEAVRHILRAYSCPAVFFVVPQLVGSAIVPWWDEIAFLIRNCRSSILELSYPLLTKIELSADREPAIVAILKLFKSAENREPGRFLRELRQIIGVQVPDQSRRFMNWSEICDLADSGMEIGSHTSSHPILSKLPPEEQYQELLDSKSLIEMHTRKAVRALAYPVGSHSAFTDETERLVRRAGYEVAFSFYGGINTAKNCRLTDIRRLEPSADPSLFRTEIALLRHGRRVP
jgi:peptidoglycan/xylan/chitin deacetylase (PgdA/CDA1 family)